VYTQRAPSQWRLGVFCVREKGSTMSTDAKREADHLRRALAGRVDMRRARDLPKIPGSSFLAR
jgi:hypothetical protein